MSLKEGLMGTPSRIAQVPNQMQKNQIYDKNQSDVLNYLLSKGKSGLENPYAGFEPISQQTRSNFEQQTLPSIAERFTSMGNNSLSSPSFASSLSQGGAGLEQMLAAMKAEYGQRNQNAALQQLMTGLQPRNQFSPKYQNFPQDGQGGFFSQLLPGLLSTGGAIAGGMLGGGPGAVAGSGLGSFLSSLFGGGKDSKQGGYSGYGGYNSGGIVNPFMAQNQYGSGGTDYGKQFGLDNGYFNLGSF